MWLLNLFKKEEIKVGDIFVDKEWGDTALKIIKVHENKRLFKYIFLKIDDKKIENSSVYKICINGLKWNYTKLHTENDFYELSLFY